MFRDLRPTAPLYFLVEDEPAPARGYQLFKRCQDDIPAIWRSRKVPDEIMVLTWEAWVAGAAGWLRKMNYHRMSFEGPKSLPHAMLMLDLGITTIRPFASDDE